MSEFSWMVLLFSDNSIAYTAFINYETPSAT